MHYMYVQDKHMITINLLLGQFAFVAHSGLAVCRDRHRYFENIAYLCFLIRSGVRGHTICPLSTETVRPLGLIRPPFHFTNYEIVQSTISKFFSVWNQSCHWKLKSIDFLRDKIDAVTCK